MSLSSTLIWTIFIRVIAHDQGGDRYGVHLDQECLEMHFYGGKFDGDLAPKSAGEIDWGVSWLLRCIHVFGGISFLRGHFEVHLFPRERIFKRMRRRFQKRSPMDPCFPGLEEG